MKFPRILARAALTMLFSHAHVATGLPDDLWPYPADRLHTNSEAGRRPEFADFENTIAGRMARGLTFAQATNHRISRDGLDLFDRRTGHLLPPPQFQDAEMTLASESGTQPLLALQANYAFNESEAPVKDALLRDYRLILERLPGLELIFAVRWEQERELFWEISRWPESIRARVFIFSHSQNWSPWTQDLAKPVLRTLTSLGGSDPYHDATRVNYVFRGYIESHSVPFTIIGGNIVVGDRDVFVGRGLIDSLARELWAARPEILDLLSHKFGKPVLEVGGPAGTVSFHIDLDMAVVRDWSAPAHREVVLLQSPILLIEALLQKPVRSWLKGFPSLDPASVRAFDELRREALGELEELGDVDPDARVTWRALLTHMDLYALGAEDLEYRHYRETFETKGYRVIEIPGTAILHKFTVKPKAPSLTRPMSGPPNFVSYVNLIASGSMAILPNYKIPRLDRAAYEVLNALGYEVLPVSSTIGTMRWNGGIRCLHATYRETISLCSCARALLDR